jgi:hypothetical protein
MHNKIFNAWVTEAIDRLDSGLLVLTSNHGQTITESSILVDCLNSLRSQYNVLPPQGENGEQQELVNQLLYLFALAANSQSVSLNLDSNFYVENGSI